MLITKHVTLQKIVAHDFRYDLRIYLCGRKPVFVLRSIRSDRHLRSSFQFVQSYINFVHNNMTHLFIYLFIYPSVNKFNSRQE